MNNVKPLWVLNIDSNKLVPAWPSFVRSNKKKTFLVRSIYRPRNTRGIYIYIYSRSWVLKLSIHIKDHTCPNRHTPLSAALSVLGSILTWDYILTQFVIIDVKSDRIALQKRLFLTKSSRRTNLPIHKTARASYLKKNLKVDSSTVWS